MMSLSIWSTLHRYLRRKGKIAFLYQVKRQGRVLDIGCGNNSPLKAKLTRPDIFYIGLDIADYNISENYKAVANKYVIVAADEFARGIRNVGSVDAVISSHNLEHCNDRRDVLEAIVNALNPGGRLYLSFPSIDSVGFPSRAGCLNFYDDKTHREPVDLDEVVSRLSRDLIVDHRINSYRPWVLRMFGLCVEPLSRMMGRVMPGTWEWYGFESIVWAHKPDVSEEISRLL